MSIANWYLIIGIIIGCILGIAIGIRFVRWGMITSNDERFTKFFINVLVLRSEYKMKMEELNRLKNK